MSENMTVNNLISPGARLKYVREQLIKLSRAEISKKYGLSPDTLAAWENEKIPVTEKGIDRCIKIYNSENLLVSKEWLLTGEGLSPNFSFELSRYFKNFPSSGENSEADDHFLLIKEIEYFKSLSQNSIVALVPNQDMLPLYSIGDHVGGRLKYDNDIRDCVGKDCIILLEDEAVCIRRVAKGKDDNHYNLVCINPSYDGNSEPVMFNMKIKSAAPIIWHRRLDD